MRLRPLYTITSGALALAIALSGCGSSGSKSRSSATAAASAGQTSTTSGGATTGAGTTSTGGQTPASATPYVEPIADIPLSSAATLQSRGHHYEMSSRYTCDGGNVSLPLKWGKVPANTAELYLYIWDEEQPTFVNWAVTGISPQQGEIGAGSLPPGAVVGRNGYGQTGYSICPPKGRQHRYAIWLIALPRHLSAQQGFDPVTLKQEATRSQLHIGIYGFGYKRA
jgi:phosphatidylethanolamine-binding protein (PEBP) family uncharacterized protein